MNEGRRDSHATGMAAEFHVMGQLFRLGHSAALTLGNAKSIDILVRTKVGKHYEVSVKGVRDGSGKWGVSSLNESAERGRIYVLLLYKDFEDLATAPIAWVIPAPVVQKMKCQWQAGTGVYYSGANRPKKLDNYREAWGKCFK